jgi:hypothetical protein
MFQRLKFVLSGLLIFSWSFLPAESQHTVYVAKISWHTGLILPVYALPDSIWPDQFQPARDEYLEIGWGDRDYYTHPGFNFWYALKALFWPTPTALHILPLLERHIPDTYASTKLVKLSLSDQDLENLSHFVLSQFELNDQGKLIPVEEGLYQTSRFFAGSTKYYFPKNSNVWAAMALKRAGFKYAPVFFQTTGMVVNRADNYGELVGKE